MAENITFQSDGLKLAGIVETPADLKPGERRPAFIVLHGFGGNKDGQGQTVVAKQFTDWGFVTLRIDFRGCGESEGEHGQNHLPRPGSRHAQCHLLLGSTRRKSTRNASRLSAAASARRSRFLLAAPTVGWQR